MTDRSVDQVVPLIPFLSAKALRFHDIPRSTLHADGRGAGGWDKYVANEDVGVSAGNRS
jgi:hypothetical protein